jgi:hypothetical protein
MPHKKFVLMGAARSGSSHLMLMFRNTPRVHMHGEVFHPNPQWAIWGDFIKDRGLAWRDEDPVGFVSQLLEFAPPGTLAVGCKMWRRPHENASRHLLADETVHKIFLERENRLAIYTSTQLARQSGVWNASARALVKADHVPKFDPPAFDKSVKFYDNLFRFYRRHARGPVLNITYADVLRGIAYERCITFLALPKGEEQPQGMAKLRPSDIVSRFAESERPAVVEHLARIGRPEWATETA